MQKLILAGAGALARRMALAAGFAVLAVSPAMAQVRVVDQSNGAYAPSTPTPGQTPSTAVRIPIGQNSLIGQTFTPTLDGLNFASFRLSNQFTDTPVSLNVSVYSGFDNFGADKLLATSHSVDVPGLTNTKDIYFFFSDTVSLNPGSVYSLIVNDLNFNRTGIVDDVDLISGDEYHQGNVIKFGKISGALGDSDFVFSEGLASAAPAVPEPATWAMMTLGFGAMGFAMRRRRAGVARLA